MNVDWDDFIPLDSFSEDKVGTDELKTIAQLKQEELEGLDNNAGNGNGSTFEKSDEEKGMETLLRRP